MTEPLHVTAPDLSALVQTPAALAARKGAPPGDLEKAAKNFESILLSTLLQEMGKTIESSGLLESGMTQQVQGIFWMYLSQDLASRGGLGLWKDLLGHMPAAAGTAGIPRGEGVSPLRPEGISRGEGVPPLRAEGILPSVASSSSSSAASAAAASSSFKEERRAEEAKEETRGQDARGTQGQDALATPTEMSR